VGSLTLAASLVGASAGAAVTAALNDDSRPAAAPTALDRVDPTGRDDTPASTVEQVATAVLPSVVSIEVSGPRGGGEGSGVVISADGLILTNNHVVAGAATGSLQVTFSDGTTAPARIVGLDPVTDLAVIKATGVSGLTPATLGRSADLDPGEQVVAIGSPLGLQGTVTTGIVSALNRPVRTGTADGAETTSTVIDAIQTDAAINPGNSGGPLVNLRGEVVGINSAIATLGGLGGQAGSIGLGFSIPIDQARVVANQLVDTGSATHAQLGVSVQDSTEQDPAGVEGAVIAVVTPGGAAERAGLRTGDVVTDVGDRAVDSPDSLIAAIRSHRPGDEVTVTYRRGGTERDVLVRLGSDG
jgi:putative serine protease PepD